MAISVKKSALEPGIFEVFEKGVLVEEIEVLFPLKERIPAFNGIEELKCWLREKEQKLAKKTALFWLARRDYLRRELREKLERKGFSERVVAELLHSLYEMKLLNDEQFLDRKVEQLLVKGKGPYYIAAKLAIPLEEVKKRISREQEQKSLSKLLEKYANEPREKLRAKLFRLGFDIRN